MDMRNRFGGIIGDSMHTAEYSGNSDRRID